MRQVSSALLKMEDLTELNQVVLAASQLKQQMQHFQELIMFQIIISSEQHMQRTSADITITQLLEHRYFIISII